MSILFSTPIVNTFPPPHTHRYKIPHPHPPFCQNMDESDVRERGMADTRDDELRSPTRNAEIDNSPSVSWCRHPGPLHPPTLPPFLPSVVWPPACSSRPSGGAGALYAAAWRLLVIDGAVHWDACVTPCALPAPSSWAGELWQINVFSHATISLSSFRAFPES